MALPLRELGAWFIGQIFALTALLFIALVLIARNQSMKRRYFNAAAGAIILFNGGREGFKHAV